MHIIGRVQFIYLKLQSCLIYFYSDINTLLKFAWNIILGFLFTVKYLLKRAHYNLASYILFLVF